MEIFSSMKIASGEGAHSQHVLRRPTTMKLSTLCAAWLSPLLFAFASYAGTTNSVVNLSHYDTVRPHFEMMARQGVIAAIHEATFPFMQVDPAYAERQRAALQAGLCWGAYHFGDASNPVKQADHFVDVVENHWRQAGSNSKSGVVLVLDFEANNHYPGGTMTVDQAAAFVERVRQRTGHYPGLYSNENRIKTILNSSSVSNNSRRSLLNCWLWIANYHRKPEATSPWQRWDLWQYTGDGICGLPRSSYPIAAANMSAAERNIFNGSAGGLRSFWETHGWLPGN